MRVVRWPGETARVCERSVATLGVFDGVHRGHQRVLRTTREQARRRGCPAVVITFDRHPSAVLAQRPQPCITSLEHRLRLFEEMGLDVAVVVEFDEAVAGQPPEEFARRVFVGLLGAEMVVLGFDSRFGRDAAGDADLLRELAPQLGFAVDSVKPVEVGGERVSSTAIRRAILRGDLERAERLLGRPFSLYGTVVHGRQRGRRLGFPTANLDLHNETVPPEGVYATWIFVGERPLPSVTSIGHQPTFADTAPEQPLVEVHVIEHRLDLYGQDVEVQFAARLRGQRQFPDHEALREQIARDIDGARRVLAACEARRTTAI